MSKLIPLHGKYGDGKFAIVDDADFDWLNQYKWHVTRDGYANHWRYIDGVRINFKMHKMILEVPDGFLVDHKNQNTFDNRRDNLRQATRAQNNTNCAQRKHKQKSKYRGVSFHSAKKYKKPWVATLRANNKDYYFGHYATEEEAARARDVGALFYHGEFAVLNFPL